MAVSRVRAVQVPWDSQPQEWTPIDEMSPLNEDLVLSVRGGRGFLDEVQGGYPTIAAGVSISPGAFGPEFTFSGSQADNSFTFGASTLLSGATAATWDLLAYFNAANPTAQIFSQWDGGNQNWLLQASAGSLIWVACDDSGGGRTRFDLSGAFPAAGYYRITAAWRGGASFKLLINGVDRSSSVTTVSSAGSVMSGGFDGLKLGMATSQTALNGRIAYARIWKRGLGDPALSSLLAGNWEIYAPQQILVPVSSVTVSALLALSASVASSAAISKAVSATKAATSTATTAITRTTAFVRSATTTTSATLASIKAKLMTLSASLTSSAAVVRSVSAIRSASAASSGAVARAVSATRSATTAATAAIIKRPALLRSATTTLSATLGTVKAKLLTLAATLTTSGAVVRSVSITRSASATVTGLVVKLVGLTRSAGSSITAALATFFIGGGALTYIAALRRMVSPSRAATLDSPDRSVTLSSADRDHHYTSAKRDDIQ